MGPAYKADLNILRMYPALAQLDSHYIVSIYTNMTILRPIRWYCK